MCICGKDREYKECCGSIITHKREAKTPEELMRSRYSAYVKGDVAYLLESSLNENRDPNEAKLIEEFASSVVWLKLDIVNAEDDIVEFKAYYKENGKIQLLHEKSHFVQVDGVWNYKDGELYNSKIERNEPCPCGSGKKYKKCCAK